MIKEVLIYSDVTGRSAADFITQVNEIEEGDSLTVRVNTDGGSPEYTYGIVSKFNEFEGDKLVKIDGKAYSAGLFFACFAENVEALDVSQFLVHRAAYGSWFEESTYFTEALKANLASINKDLETAFRNKIDVDKFESLKSVKQKNITVKDIFSMDDRIDVFLTASEAKKIGLISKINKITPSKKAKIDAGMMQIAAKYNLKVEEEVKPVVEANNNKPNKNNINMTIEKFKAEHPGVFAEVRAIGVAEERDRVGAWQVFADADPEAVAAGIKSGKPLTSTETAELTVKKVSAASLAALALGNAEPVLTDAEKAAKATADALLEDDKLSDVQKLQAKLDKELGTEVNTK